MFRIVNACLMVLIAAVSVAAQTAKLSAQTDKPPSTKPSPSSDSSGGYAIESEMLTYTAVERSSQVIGCDVARLLYGVSDQAVLPCSFRPPASPLSPVVIVSASSTLMADFQQWRSDMATMQLLNQGAAQVCGSSRGT